MDFDKLPEKSYWNSKGKHDEQNDILWKKLVPAEGKAKTLHGEALRCITRIYYDLYNNGGGNNLSEQFGFLKWASDDIVENSSWDVKMFDSFSKWIQIMENNWDNIEMARISPEMIERMTDCVIEHCYFVEFGERLDQPVKA